jgi:hypothetical protein
VALEAGPWGREVDVSVNELPFDRDASPLAAAAAWMLERFVEGELTVAQASDPRWVHPVDVVEQRRAMFAGFRRPIVDVLGYEEVDGVIARIAVVDDRDRRMRVLVMQHPDHPGKVWQAAMLLDPPGVAVREAAAEDRPELRSLELATPVQHDGFEVAYDRPDPFAQDRLRPRPTLRCVAEIDGRVVGTHTDALHVLVTDAGPVRIAYRQHSRVLPSEQGNGVMPAMNAFQAERLFRDGVSREVLAFMARGNEKVRAWSKGSTSGRDATWRTPIVRYALDTRSVARQGDIRPGSATDDAHVCDMLNATHGRSVFWPGDAHAWFPARMTMSPDDYSWNDLVVSDHAVVGVWDAGWAVVRSSGDTQTRHRVATVLDWGFSPDRPDSLAATLAAACQVAATRGIGTLHVFGGPPATGCEVLADLCAAAETFAVFAGAGLTEPARAATDGIYVDPLYF